MSIQADKEITAEASSWLAQLETGQLSAADLAAFREWIGRSPRHAAEIRAIADISAQLNTLTDITEHLEEAAGVHSDLRRPSRLKWGLVAASLACVGAVVMGLMFVLMQPRAANTMIALHETSVGQYETLQLTDGSTIRLNTNSQVEITFSALERRARLLRGEALFDVAKDVQRPFVVYSGQSVAQAVGTAFVVRLRRDQVTELSVIEGTVAFSKAPPASKKVSNTPDAAAPEPKPILVKANQALKDSDFVAAAQIKQPTPALAAMTKRDIQRKLSWTEGLFDFSETPLTEVVEELERHNGISIAIADPALHELRFGGIFRTGDVEPMLEAFESVGVIVERQEDGKILLRGGRKG